MNVPKLRFNEYNDSWSDRKISDFVTSLDAGVSVNSEEREPFKHEFSILKTSCVTSGLFNAKERKAVTNKGELSRLKERLLDKSIVISRMNTPLLVGANAYVEKAPPDTFLPDRLWQIKLNENLANMRWFSYWLNTDRNLVKIRDLATGTSNSMKNITKPDLLGVNLYLPTLPEQTKIANFLTAVDEKISQLTQKTDLLAQYKKGVMQQIFSQELRFKDDDGGEFPEWESKTLNDVANIVMGSSPQSLAYNEECNGLPLIQGNADIKARKSAPRIYTSQITKECFPSDILLSVRAPVGTAAISYHHACIGRGIAAIRTDKENSQAFLYQWLLSYEPRWKSLSQGSTFEAVNTDDIKSLELPVPHLKEQIKIANFLAAIDDKIIQTQAELDAVKQYKQGLLQQMFV